MIPALAAAAMAATFNLVCSGQTIEGNYQPGREMPRQPDFSHVFRVNLTTKRYCIDRCNSTAAIESIDPTVIVFRTGTDSIRNIIGESVNRENGEYLYTAKHLPWQHVEAGVCKRAPFTGFPTRQF